MTEPLPPSSSVPGGDGQPPRKRRRRRRRGKKTDGQTPADALDTTATHDGADDSSDDSDGPEDAASDATTTRSDASTAERDESATPSPRPNPSGGYSNPRSAPPGSDRGPRDRNNQEDRNAANRGRGPRDRNTPPPTGGPRPTGNISGIGSASHAGNGPGRGKPAPQANRGNNNDDDDGGKGGKKRRKPRTKQCIHCLTPCTTIHRVQLDYRKQWVFICDICWPTRCVNNPHYNYGGMWVSGRIVKPESQLRDEARARQGGPHPHAPQRPAPPHSDQPRDVPNPSAQAVLETEHEPEIEGQAGDDLGDAEV